MHQAIPERSINCPMSSSSGTSVASWSRERSAYLLIIESVSRVHVQRGIHVGHLVLALAVLRSLLTLLRHLRDHSVELGAEREAEIVGQENRHLLKLVLSEFAVEQCGVGLNLGKVLYTER